MTGKTSQLYRQKNSTQVRKISSRVKIYKKVWEVKIETDMKVYQKKSKKGSD